jgi:hypothetical protein
VLPNLVFVKNLPFFDCPLLLKSLYPLTLSQLYLGETLEIPENDRVLVSKLSVFEIRLYLLVVMLVRINYTLIFRLIFIPAKILLFGPGITIDRKGIMVLGVVF